MIDVVHLRVSSLTSIAINAPRDKSLKLISIFPICLLVLLVFVYKTNLVTCLTTKKELNIIIVLISFPLHF